MSNQKLKSVKVDHKTYVLVPAGTTRRQAYELYRMNRTLYKKKHSLKKAI